MITDQFTESSSSYQSPSTGGTAPPTVHPANGRWRLRARSGRSNMYTEVGSVFNRQTLGWLSVGLALGALFAPRARARALVTAGVVGAIAVADIAASTRAASGHAYTRRQADPTVSASLIVNKTPQECYEFWRKQSHPEREITADVPGSHIGWRSADESDVEHAGVVRFHPATGVRGTVVRIVMRGRTAGAAAGLLGKLMSKVPDFEVTQELRRFKQLLETGEIATTRGQPSGRRSLLGSRLPSGRLSRQGKL